MSTIRTLKDFGDLKIKTVKKPVQKYKFSNTQNYLYRKAIMGLNGIPEDLVHNMADEHKREICNLARKVQRFLNIWKQEICIEKTNNLFLELFGNTDFTKDLIEDHSMPYPKYFNTLDFKVLGITKEVIIEKLIKEEYLSSNFHDL